MDAAASLARFARLIGEMKALSARVLPGVRYRRHWLGRYSLVWHKPL